MAQNAAQACNLPTNRLHDAVGGRLVRMIKNRLQNGEQSWVSMRLGITDPSKLLVAMEWERRWRIKQGLPGIPPPPTIPAAPAPAPAPAPALPPPPPPPPSPSPPPPPSPQQPISSITVRLPPSATASVQQASKVILKRPANDDDEDANCQFSIASKKPRLDVSNEQTQEKVVEGIEDKKARENEDDVSSEFVESHSPLRQHVEAVDGLSMFQKASTALSSSSHGNSGASQLRGFSNEMNEAKLSKTTSHNNEDEKDVSSVFGESHHTLRPHVKTVDGLSVCNEASTAYSSNELSSSKPQTSITSMTMITEKDTAAKKSPTKALSAENIHHHGKSDDNENEFDDDIDDDLIAAADKIEKSAAGPITTTSMPHVVTDNGANNDQYGDDEIDDSDLVDVVTAFETDKTASKPSDVQTPKSKVHVETDHDESSFDQNEINDSDLANSVASLQTEKPASKMNDVSMPKSEKHDHGKSDNELTNLNKNNDDNAPKIVALEVEKSTAKTDSKPMRESESHDSHHHHGESDDDLIMLDKNKKPIQRENAEYVTQALLCEHDDIIREAREQLRQHELEETFAYDWRVQKTFDTLYEETMNDNDKTFTEQEDAFLFIIVVAMFQRNASCADKIRGRESAITSTHNYFTFPMSNGELVPQYLYDTHIEMRLRIRNLCELLSSGKSILPGNRGLEIQIGGWLTDSTINCLYALTMVTCADKLKNDVVYDHRFLEANLTCHYETDEHGQLDVYSRIPMIETLRDQVVSQIVPEHFEYPGLGMYHYDDLIMPYNVNNNHWVLARILSTGMILVYNSLPSYDRILQQVSAAELIPVAQIAAAFPESRFAGKEFSGPTICHPIIQPNSDDCGIAVAWQTRTLLTGVVEQRITTRTMRARFLFEMIKLMGPVHGLLDNDKNQSNAEAVTENVADAPPTPPKVTDEKSSFGEEDEENFQHGDDVEDQGVVEAAVHTSVDSTPLPSPKKIVEGDSLHTEDESEEGSIYAPSNDDENELAIKVDEDNAQKSDDMTVVKQSAPECGEHRTKRQVICALLAGHNGQFDSRVEFSTHARSLCERDGIKFFDMSLFQHNFFKNIFFGELRRNPESRNPYPINLIDLPRTTIPLLHQCWRKDDLIVDDLEVHYDLVIVLRRRSARPQRGYMQHIDASKLWEHWVFSNCPNLSEENGFHLLEDHQDLSALRLPAYVLVNETKSSRSPFLERPGHILYTELGHDGKRILWHLHELIDEVIAKVSRQKRNAKILVLQSGFDGSSTDISSYKRLTTKWAGHRFQITMALNPQVVRKCDIHSVLRNRIHWVHLDAEEVSHVAHIGERMDSFDGGEQFQSSNVGIYVQACRSINMAKTILALRAEHRSNHLPAPVIPENEQELADMHLNFTSHNSRMFIEKLKIQTTPRRCELCQITQIESPDRWHRGSTPDSFWCSKCSCQDDNIDIEEADGEAESDSANDTVKVNKEDIKIQVPKVGEHLGKRSRDRVVVIHVSDDYVEQADPIQESRRTKQLREKNFPKQILREHAKRQKKIKMFRSKANPDSVQMVFKYSEPLDWSRCQSCFNQNKECERPSFGIEACNACKKDGKSKSCSYSYCRICKDGKTSVPGQPYACPEHEVWFEREGFGRARKTKMNIYERKKSGTTSQLWALCSVCDKTISNAWSILSEDDCRKPKVWLCNACIHALRYFLRNLERSGKGANKKKSKNDNSDSEK